MKLFDRIDSEEEEVVLQSDEAEQEESRLRRDVEEKVTESNTDTSVGSTASSSATASTGSVDLPGMESNATASSSEPTMEDIHSQNKKIISLLEDIKSEVGSGNELL